MAPQPDGPGRSDAVQQQQCKVAVGASKLQDLVARPHLRHHCSTIPGFPQINVPEKVTETLSVQRQPISPYPLGHFAGMRIRTIGQNTRRKAPSEVALSIPSRRRPPIGAFVVTTFMFPLSRKTCACIPSHILERLDRMVDSLLRPLNSSDARQLPSTSTP